MLNSLTPDSLGTEFQPHLSTQDYSKKPTIDGVKLLDLRLMLDDGGSFAELVRLTEEGALEAFPDFTPRQSSYSEVLPGAIKAFHLHFNQEDVWFVPPTHRLLIGLVDVRKDSPTYKVSQRFVMGAGRAQLLHIPRGVGHGGANIWQQPASILYFVNQQFDLANPDERRLPWDVLGADFWQLSQG
jgi:dTDP-4-dehydrorhamnose 3,5-epimerase-like enzyme